MISTTQYALHVSTYHTFICNTIIYNSRKLKVCQEIVSDDTYWSLTAVFESPEWLQQNVGHAGTLVFRIHRNQVFFIDPPINIQYRQDPP